MFVKTMGLAGGAIADRAAGGRALIAARMGPMPGDQLGHTVCRPSPRFQDGVPLVYWDWRRVTPAEPARPAA